MLELKSQDGVSEAAAGKGRGEWGLMMHLPTGGKITEEKSEIAVVSRANEQERARCIEYEITEAILEVIEMMMIKTKESMRMVGKEERMIRREERMMRREIVEEFDRMVELKLRDVMDMGIGLWEAYEAEAH